MQQINLLNLTSRKSFFALEVILIIAAASDKPRGCNSRQIAELQKLKPRYLEAILQKLTRGGVLQGVRGPHGGYKFARAWISRSVADVLRLIENEETDLPIPNTKIGQQIVSPLWHEIQQQTLHHLEKIKISDLCKWTEAVAA